jgi:hypothetical protein
MKKMVLFLFCSLASLPLIAAPGQNTQQQQQVQQIPCSPALQPYLAKLLQVEEVRTLIGEIQKEGPIQLIANNQRLSQQFGAYWDLDKRAICVNLSSHYSEGQVIGSILFELHNAIANSKLEYYDAQVVAGKLDRAKYVEAIEYLEYENSLKAAALAKRGIALGLFPADSALPTYRNFEEHFKYQKIGGHSAFIAQNYDRLSRMR